jgi:hypothetical protein
MRSRRGLPAAFEAFGFELGGGLEALGGACGCGERVACGAWGAAVCFFLDELSVSELLFRRSPLALRFSDAFALDEACLVHAEAAARVTLCWT